MASKDQTKAHWLDENLPKSLILTVIIVTLLPWVLIACGVDFGAHDFSLHMRELAGTPAHLMYQKVYGYMSGTFVYNLLEWTAFCVALMTVIFAFIHYQMAKELAVPIICIALFFSGSMDALAVFAMDHFIFDIHNQAMIENVWATGRVLNALVLAISALVIIVSWKRSKHLQTRTLFLLIIAGGVVAFALTYYLYASGISFNHIDAGELIERPYDVIALVLYLVCLTFLYPWLYRIEQTSFAYALILMAFVKVMAESYISFGSEAAFDSYFNVAQFLKIVAYLVPFMALMLDYMRLHKKEIKQRIKIAEQKVALEDSNRELDEFAYIVSHDLKEPLRGIQSYAQFVQEDYDEKLDDEGRKMLGSLVRLGDRMQHLIGDLLTYSRVGRVELATQKCNLNNVVDSVLELLSARLASDNIKVKFEHDLPVITCDKTRIHEVFMNFISNSIKYNDKAERWVEVGCEPKKIKNKMGELKEVLTFYVGDNGIGIPEKHQEKVFGIFKRLHGKDKFGGGTGSGLTITKKIIERHNGQVWISSVEGEGTRFYFTIGKIEGS